MTRIHHIFVKYLRSAAPRKTGTFDHPRHASQPLQFLLKAVALGTNSAHVATFFIVRLVFHCSNLLDLIYPNQYSPQRRGVRVLRLSSGCAAIKQSARGDSSTGSELKAVEEVCREASRTVEPCVLRASAVYSSCAFEISDFVLNFFYSPVF